MPSATTAKKRETVTDEDFAMRYSTEVEARAGHELTVAAVKKRLGLEEEDGLRPREGRSAEAGSQDGLGP